MDSESLSKPKRLLLLPFLIIAAVCFGLVVVVWQVPIDLVKRRWVDALWSLSTPISMSVLLIAWTFGALPEDKEGEVLPSGDA
jgi:steroid 5-alpha reductase family enzyme